VTSGTYVGKGSTIAGDISFTVVVNDASHVDLKIASSLLNTDCKNEEVS